MTISHDLAYDLLIAFSTESSTEFSTEFTSGLAERSVALPAPAPAIGPVVPAPDAPLPPGLDLAQVLQQRRSTRFFDQRPISVTLLTALLRKALADSGGDDLEAYVVAWRVTGLEAAIHRFDGTQYVPVMPLPDQDHHADLTLQPEFSDAAVIVSFAMPLDAVVARDGAHGYRRLMVQTSGAAYGMWLDAVAQHLVGSVFAGFLPAAVRGPLRSDGTSRIQAFALALGHPAAAPTQTLAATGGE